MSSIIGHALIGAAVGDNVESKSVSEKTMFYVFFTALSIAPDLDYLPSWFWGLTMEPRYSHSIGGCLIISIVGLIAAKYCRTFTFTKIFIVLLLLAPFLHIVMDYMVGVHKNPILWPLVNNTYASSFGVLPSAGRLNITNIYLWRNLGIEVGVLLPLVLVISSTGRQLARKNAVVCAVAILSLLSFGYIAHGLHR